MKKYIALGALVAFMAASLISACSSQKYGKTADLSREEIDNIVRRSYQYVAMYNVINKGALQNAGLTNTGGWNVCVADTELKDHNLKTIARPNNDTLYAVCMMDLRHEPVVIEYPAFDSKYVVLETSAYDHYCDTPLSTTKGDFKEPRRILYYTERTEGYSGEAVEGIDTVMEMSGDFAVAFLRVMPHAAEPERMKRNIAVMKTVQPRTLSQYQGRPGKPSESADCPAVGGDFEVFENNFPEVMQFAFNHTTFDPRDEMDQAVLSALELLGVIPGKPFDPESVANFDGKVFGETARRIARQQLDLMSRPEGNPFVYDLFKPKGQMTLEAMVAQSVIGPIGVPAHQAVYPPVTTSDGTPMNAMYDYVIRMSGDRMPPATAFWSVTLYDSENGFFIPNDRKKYSVGENAGMKLDRNGGIEIYIAAERPNGVPEENWLPISRRDEVLDVIMRIYGPDLGKMKSWTAPKAEKLAGNAD